MKGLKLNLPRPPEDELTPRSSRLGPYAKLTSTPRSELMPMTPRESSSSRFIEKGSRVTLVKLPSFHNVPPKQREELLIKKLTQCCVMFDFSDPLSNASSKEVKRETLAEITEYITQNRSAITEAIYPAVFQMVTKNIGRPLAPRLNPTGVLYDPDEDAPILEAAWPHLSLVYELFIVILEYKNLNVNTAKQYCTTKFILKILDLFDSEDPRERDYLKTTLHRIYGKFVIHRAFIRKEISNIFLTFVYETDCHNGIAELLEILGSIINGFALPLKNEHKEFLQKALLPLHKPRLLSLYHTQLSYCVAQYLGKDPSLTVPIYTYLIRVFPTTNSKKELMFLNEIEDLLYITQPSQLEEALDLLFRKLGECMSNTHFQVAERTLFFFNNDQFVNIISTYYETCLTVLFPYLMTSINNHWQPSIAKMSLHCLTLLKEINPSSYMLLQKEQKLREERPKDLSKIADSPGVNRKLRRKSLLPVDFDALDAISSHKALDAVQTENQ